MAVGRDPEGVVVVTGTGGMGMAIARRLGTGRHLVLAEYAADSLAEAARVLADEGHTVHEVAIDISDAQAVRDLAAQAAGLGPLLTIAHTAGVSPVQASPARIVAVDVLGTARLLDAFEPHARAGTVMICIASMAGSMTPLPRETELVLATTPTDQLADLPLLDPETIDPRAAYGIAKRANQVRVEAASVAWGRRGARVVSISPGIISTPMGQQELAGPSGDMMRHMIETSGTGRVGTPEDIAAAVEFLASPAASFITGTDLLVDGGVVAALRYAAAVG